MSSTSYREEIIELYREPLNFGSLKTFDVSSRQLNPFCGDEIELFIRFKRGKITNIGFVGSGCVISIVAASLLTEHSRGKTKKELTNFSQEDMLNLLGIEVSETRKKCAFLGHSVLRDCLNNYAKV